MATKLRFEGESYPLSEVPLLQKMLSYMGHSLVVCDPQQKALCLSEDMKHVSKILKARTVATALFRKKKKRNLSITFLCSYYLLVRSLTHIKRKNRKRKSLLCDSMKKNNMS